MHAQHPVSSGGRRRCSCLAAPVSHRRSSPRCTRVAGYGGLTGNATGPKPLFRLAGIPTAVAKRVGERGSSMPTPGMASAQLIEQVLARSAALAPEGRIMVWLVGAAIPCSTHAWSASNAARAQGRIGRKTLLPYVSTP